MLCIDIHNIKLFVNFAKQTTKVRKKTKLGCSSIYSRNLAGTFAQNASKRCH